MPDYSKGKIYKIECNITGEVYYGSTAIQYLCERIGRHKYSAKNNTDTSKTTSKQIINRGNYNYKIIEYYPCNSKEELLARERWWIENNVCINKHIPLRTQAEYKEEHKEEIKSRKIEKLTCECGVIYARTNKARHIKSKKHQDFISHHTDTP